jgi:hypothetical protein
VAAGPYKAVELGGCSRLGLYVYRQSSRRGACKWLYHKSPRSLRTLPAHKHRGTCRFAAVRGPRVRILLATAASPQRVCGPPATTNKQVHNRGLATFSKSGTGSSNPLRSSGESGKLRPLRAENPGRSCRGTRSSNPSPSSRQSVSLPQPLSSVKNPGFPCRCARLA